MSTPLYSFLKNGMSTYAFPSASQDLGHAFQNNMVDVNFTHYALLNLPAQRLTVPKRWNFTYDPPQFDGDPTVDGTGFVSASPSSAASFAEQLVESLRNYVANQDETLRVSRTGPNKLYYDQSVLDTPTERILFSWLKDLGVMQFELADGPPRAMFKANETGDPLAGEDWTWRVAPEEDDTAGKLTKDNDGNPSWFRNGYWYEVYWKEREVRPVGVQTVSSGGSSRLKVALDVTGEYLEVTIEDRSKEVTYVRTGDWVHFAGTLDAGISPTPISAEYLGYTGNQRLHRVVSKTTSSVANPTPGAPLLYTTTVKIPVPDGAPLSAVWDAPYCLTSDPLRMELFYSRVVVNVGEISGVNNVLVGSDNVGQVMATVYEQVGMTPKVLFRTKADKNYRPGLAFPLLPAEWEKTVVQGGDQADSPLVTDPDSYPGSRYAQFDSGSVGRWQYQISAGDLERRTGDFFGVRYRNLSSDLTQDSFDRYEVQFDPSSLDGLSVVFNTQRYTDMNSFDPQFPELEARNFTEFSAIPYGGEAPKDFEFNAVLWYYTVRDRATGEQTVNLHSVSFVNTPDNACGAEKNVVPTLKKYAPKTGQDGTSWDLTLNLTLSVSSQQMTPRYDPTLGHNLRDFNIYSTVMQQVVGFNDSLSKVLEDNAALKADVSGLTSLVYSQSQISDINERLAYLDSLLNLYSTNQIVSSDSIAVSTDVSQSPPRVTLRSVETEYGVVETVRTSGMYDATFSRSVSRSVDVPDGRSLLVRVLNDDTVATVLDGPLVLELSKDMAPGQVAEVLMLPSGATQNKGLTVRVRNSAFDPLSVSQPEWLYAVEAGDLPVDLNPQYADVLSPGSAGLSVSARSATPDLVGRDIASVWSKVSPEATLVVVLSGKHRYLQPGDAVKLDGFDFRQYGSASSRPPERMYRLSAQLPLKSVLHNDRGADSPGAVDAYLRLEQGSYLPAETTALVLDYEGSTELQDLVTRLGGSQVTLLTQGGGSPRCEPAGQLAVRFNRGTRVRLVKTSGTGPSSFDVEIVALTGVTSAK